MTVLFRATATEALNRVAAVEDARTSKVLCRLAGSGGEDFVTVRLQPDTNARSLVFNDDVEGVETRVKCAGGPNAKCLEGKAPGAAHDVQECLECPCERDVDHLYGAYASTIAR